MKLLPLHTLLLLITFLHSGSCSDDNCGHRDLSVHVGGKVTIKCKIQNRKQDGVYTYIQKNNKQNNVLYYYKDGDLALEKPYKGRVETNRDFGDFSVTIRNVSVQDEGIYSCKFNYRSTFTFSKKTTVFVQSGNFLTEPAAVTNKQNRVEDYTDWNMIIYIGIICLLSFIILVLVAVLWKFYQERGDYRLRHQTPSNGIYEVMHGHTAKSLNNPAYESSKRVTHEPGVRVQQGTHSF